MCLPPYVQAAKEGGYRVLVWVQPGARRDEAAGIQDGRLRVRLKAQAQDNKANVALVSFLAGLMGIPKSGLELAAGQTNRRKTIRVLPGFEPGWRELEQAVEHG
ncbi:MAG: DUF167 domain-containing protein [Thermodesulfobacteriota bacterium]